MQPLHKADDGRYAAARLGEDRLAGTFAFRRLREAGALLGFGSDWPVVTCDPMAGLRAAVTGLTLDGLPFLTDQNLSVHEALLAYTSDAAAVLGLGDAGVIRSGALADLVMLDRDPFSADWVSAPPRVDMTIVGGRVVYDACERSPVH
jgi:predicted amidohydrolase YtcJ